METTITTKRDKAHLITSVLQDLRNAGMDSDNLSNVATAMLDQLFGEVPRMGMPPEDRTGAAFCARRVIDGEGAWEALRMFGIDERAA